MNKIMSAYTFDSPSMIRQSVLQHSLVTRRGLSERLFSRCFDGFVYNQIWEDPCVDREALRLDDRSRILTISSGGCNLLHYLIDRPERIHAVDLNRYHLHLAELKLAAICHLPSHADFYSFFGRADRPENESRYFAHIRPYLSDDAQEYWEKKTWRQGPRIGFFTRNLYDYGTMGFFIRFVHRLAKLLGRDPQELLTIGDPKKRARYFDKHFAPFFYNGLVKFIGKRSITLYSLGIPPQQFQGIVNDSKGRCHELYCERIRRMICDFPIEDNYFAWQALSRRYDHENRRAIPDYLKEEHFGTIRAHVDRVRLQRTSTTLFLRTQGDQTLNRFALLDSQDWMDGAAITDLWTEIARTGQVDSRIIFRTGSDFSPIETVLPESLRRRFHYEQELSQTLFRKDRSAIYGGFHLYVLQH